MAKHHYLAQCYLKGFVPQEHPDAIWQYRKSTRVLRMRGIGNVANLPNYYSRASASGEVDDYVEQFFGIVESEWPSHRDSLERLTELNSVDIPSSQPLWTEPITNERRKKILQFLLIHTLRIPDKIDWMRNYVRTYHPRRETLTDQEIQNLAIDGLTSIHNEVVRDWVGPFLHKPLHIAFPPIGSGVIVLTSDDPVYFKGDIREDTTFVTFPASKLIFIQFGQPTVRGDVKGDENQVQMIRDHHIIEDANCAIIQTATDEIYGSEPCYLKGLLERLDYKVELRYPELPSRGVNRMG